VPSALPLIFAGLRVSLALSFIVMFATEMINASSGLGHLIRAAESGLRFDLMYVSLAPSRSSATRATRCCALLAAASSPGRNRPHEPPESFFSYRSGLVAWELAARSGLWSPLLFPSLPRSATSLPASSCKAKG